jgi:hypothetical protein
VWLVCLRSRLNSAKKNSRKRKIGRPTRQRCPGKIKKIAPEKSNRRTGAAPLYNRVILTWHNTAMTKRTKPKVAKRKRLEPSQVLDDADRYIARANATLKRLGSCDRLRVEAYGIAARDRSADDGEEEPP